MELGDLNGAQGVLWQAVEARAHVLGREHPPTSLSAWNLFTTLNQLGNQGTAQAVLDEYLIWLRDRDPEALGADQRKIRERILEAF
jgi:hypothetical protein